MGTTNNPSSNPAPTSTNDQLSWPTPRGDPDSTTDCGAQRRNPTDPNTAVKSTAATDQGADDRGVRTTHCDPDCPNTGSDYATAAAPAVHQVGQTIQLAQGQQVYIQQE